MLLTFWIRNSNLAIQKESQRNPEEIQKEFKSPLGSAFFLQLATWVTQVVLNSFEFIVSNLIQINTRIELREFRFKLRIKTKKQVEIQI